MSDGSRPTYTTTEPGLQIAVVTLPAEIDVLNEDQIRDALAGALSGGAAVIVADASGTTFCGCAGVSALIHAHRRAATAGVQLRVAASPAVRHILELTRTDHFLRTYPTLTAALEDPQEAATPVGAHPVKAATGPLARIARIRHRNPVAGRAVR